MPDALKGALRALGLGPPMLMFRVRWLGPVSRAGRRSAPAYPAGSGEGPVVP